MARLQLDTTRGLVTETVEIRNQETGEWLVNTREQGAPPAVAFANYDGDVSDAIGQIVGPNRLGEHLRLVEVVYNRDVDASRAGFSYILTPAVRS